MKGSLSARTCAATKPVASADMQCLRLSRGLDIPLAGEPDQVVKPGPAIRHVALIGDDYPGLKPTLLVRVGETVRLGQPLFTDKKNPTVFFTAPAGGTVKEINRGAKRKFESLVIALEEHEPVTFPVPADRNVAGLPPEEIKKNLQESGLWCGFRTRPFGRIPAAADLPASLFITAVDTRPLAGDPQIILARRRDDFNLGLRVLRRFPAVPLYFCTSDDFDPEGFELDGVHHVGFRGPHPAGLPSTHIHFLDPVHAGKQVWHICCQDVIGIGHLFRTGQLPTEKTIALAGPGISNPALVRTRIGADLTELCAERLTGAPSRRILSGSVLDGRRAAGPLAYLGRYHNQVSVIPEGTSRGFLNWLRPGRDRFSVTGLFLSSLLPQTGKFVMSSATWGGQRAIFPLGTYEKVMPLDIIATPLLKSLAVQDIEKAELLGCLELIEEDLALCSFVCPGKNNYGPMLREILTTIEREG